MNNKFLLLAGAVVIVIAAGFLLLGNKTNTSKQNTQGNQNPKPTTAAKVSVTNVAVTNSGFEPQDIKIKAGTQVVWTNKSGTAVTVNSAVHPTHLLWPFLNLGEFANDSSVSVVFEKPGVYKYHNHLNPSQTGTVTVE